MKIIGIDPSTTSLGITTIVGQIDEPIFISDKIVPDKKMTPDEKFVEVASKTIDHIFNQNLNMMKVDLVICEYPFNIMGHAKVLIELFGVIRYHCLLNDIPFLPLSQSRIKKYATGKGGAEKSDMRMQVYKEYGLDLSEDEADSFWIAHFGMSVIYGANNKVRQKSIDDMKKVKVKKGRK